MRVYLWQLSVIKLNQKTLVTGTILTAKEAEISFDKPRLLQLDGEIIGEFKKLNVKINPGAVKLILKNKKS